MDPRAPNAVRHLWILRHAKAAAEGPWGSRDRDRTLTARGRRDASALGARLAAGAPLLGTPGLVRPEVALCSAAVRTVQTAELVLAEFPDRVPFDSYRSLYQAGPDTVLTYLREVDEHVRSVLVVGHNPTMYHLTWDLLEPGSGDRDTLEARGFPTCALAVMSLRVDAWEDVADGTAALSGLFAPPY